MIFAITNPEVYRIGEHYIVFGEAKMEDPAAQAAAFANQRQQHSIPSSGSSKNAGSSQGAQQSPEDANVDASGLDEKDVKIVMEQGNVGRAKAVETLRQTKGDIVSAIMELSL